MTKIITLLILWFSLMLLNSYLNENTLTVLTESYPASKISNFHSQELLAGSEVQGSFKATYNYLGILSFKFNTFHRPNDDYLRFSLREQGSTKWYYQGLYKTDQFQPDQYFPFGFPSITDSRDKVYEYMIESTAGIPGDAVGISSINPVLIIKYKYPKSALASGPVNFVKFCYDKLINLTFNSKLSFVFILPLLIYLLYISKLPWRQPVSLGLAFTGLFFVLSYQYANLLPVLILAIVFIWLFRVYQYSHHLFIFLALGMLILSTVYSPQKTGLWAYLFSAFWITGQVWRKT